MESRYRTSALLPKRLSCSASRGPALVFDRNLSSPNLGESRISESGQSCSTSTSCQSDGISGSSRICNNFNYNHTYRERSLAWLSTPKLCAVRCEPLTLLNRHFSDSDGGADRTVGNWKAVRHARLVVLQERFHRTYVNHAFLNPPSHI